MNTLEMMIKAQKDGKTYRANDLLYNRVIGFADREGDECLVYVFRYLNDLFAVDVWDVWEEE